MMKNKKAVIVCAAAFIAVIAILYGVYHIIDTRFPGRFDTVRQYLGDIETTAKKWLNGYLGVFFRFKHLGNINWLIIPLLVWFLAGHGFKKIEPWQKALLLVWLMMVVFIAVKGFDNPRYQLTLFPFTSAMVLFLMWQLLADKKKTLKVSCFILVALLCLFNIYHYSDDYKAYWDLRVSVKTPRFPYKLVDFLHSVPATGDKERILTINQPLFYYHIPKNGLDYVSPHAIGIWVEFKKRTGTVESRYNIYRMLKRKYHVNYILLNTVHRRFSRSTMLEEFLHCECQLVMEDEDRLLFRLRDKPLERQIQSPVFQHFPVWNSRHTTVESISPQFLRFFKKGTFKTEVAAEENTNIIIVSAPGAKKGEENRIHLGYEFNRGGLDCEPREYEGRFVHFIVRASGSPGIVSRENYIAIAEYNKDGSHEARKTYFTSHHWRTYIVSKKVKPGNARLVLMFRFCPQTAQDRMRIMDVKILTSKEPL